MSRFADEIAQVIRINPIPWLFAPGIALGGWLVEGVHGAATALIGWATIVAAATMWVVLRRHFRPDQLDTRP
ncbi:MAG TPA: hypothetical protein VGP22_09390 [Albitalea sp.]|nr:hypothetical protein [Albitalea sp.]